MKTDITGLAAKVFIVAIAAVIMTGNHNLKKHHAAGVAGQPAAVHATAPNI